jgi:hypothetical protein
MALDILAVSDFKSGLQLFHLGLNSLDETDDDETSIVILRG